jgi:hypothetical protein
MTILAGFSLPGIISVSLQDSIGWTKSSADTYAQLLTPCGMQILSTPLHLHGLDLYNRDNIGTKERISFIQKEYVKTTIARMMRIFPAYGIGGVVNTNLRKLLNDTLIESY